MKMSTILGGVASSAVIIAGAFIYGTAQTAEAAIDTPNVVYVNRLVEKVVYVQEPEPISIFVNISKKDRKCLALNVYFESRGESKIGQEFVAWVTLNRVTSGKFPNNVCDVVWEDKQFSWTHDGKSDKPKDQEAWLLAQKIADQVIDTYGVEQDPTEGAIFFHGDYTNPYWSDHFVKVVQIDNHIFYKEQL